MNPQMRASSHSFCSSSLAPIPKNGVKPRTHTQGDKRYREGAWTPMSCVLELMYSFIDNYSPSAGYAFSFIGLQFRLPKWQRVLPPFFDERKKKAVCP